MSQRGYGRPRGDGRPRRDRWQMGDSYIPPHYERNRSRSPTSGFYENDRHGYRSRTPPRSDSPPLYRAPRSPSDPSRAASTPSGPNRPQNSHPPGDVHSEHDGHSPGNESENHYEPNQYPRAEARGIEVQSSLSCGSFEQEPSSSPELEDGTKSPQTELRFTSNVAGKEATAPTMNNSIQNASLMNDKSAFGTMNRDSRQDMRNPRIRGTSRGARNLGEEVLSFPGFSQFELNSRNTTIGGQSYVPTGRTPGRAYLNDPRNASYAQPRDIVPGACFFGDVTFEDEKSTNNQASLDPSTYRVGGRISAKRRPFIVLTLLNSTRWDKQRAFVLPVTTRSHKGPEQIKDKPYAHEYLEIHHAGRSRQKILEGKPLRVEGQYWSDIDEKSMVHLTEPQIRPSLPGDKFLGNLKPDDLKRLEKTVWDTTILRSIPPYIIKQLVDDSDDTLKLKSKLKELQDKVQKLENKGQDQDTITKPSTTPIKQEKLDSTSVATATSNEQKQAEDTGKVPKASDEPNQSPQKPSTDHNAPEEVTIAQTSSSGEHEERPIEAEVDLKGTDANSRKRKRDVIDAST